MKLTKTSTKGNILRLLSAISFLFIVNIVFAQTYGIQGSRTAPVVANSQSGQLTDPGLPLIFEENMDDITLLESQGWIFYDEDGLGLTTYFQGNESVLYSFNGANNSYLGQNFNGAFNGGSLIDQWLITPLIHSIGPTTFSFMASSVVSPYADHFQIYYSPKGSSDLSKFVLLRDRTEIADGWNQYSETVESNGFVRFAIRYHETDGGPSGTNSDYWGLDNVQVYGTPFSVPISFWWVFSAVILIILGIVIRKFF